MTLQEELLLGICHNPIIYIPHYDYSTIVGLVSSVCKKLAIKKKECIIYDEYNMNYQSVGEYVNICRQRIAKFGLNAEEDIEQELVHIFVVNKFVVEDRDIQIALSTFAGRYEDKMDRPQSTIVLIATDMCLPPDGISGVVKVINILPPSQDEIKQLLKKEFANKIEREEDIISLCRELQGLSLYDIRTIIREIKSLYGGISKYTISLAREQKKAMISKSGILELVEPNVQLSDIGGLEVLKEDIKTVSVLYNNLDILQHPDVKIPIPKGFLLIGMPGCGKSMIAKATANELGVPLLRMDMSKILGQYVGNSEQNMRRALEIVDSAHPCVLWIDEIEKAFAGTSNTKSDNNDLMLRLMGLFLTWMQERKSAVFIMATANDVMKPEFMRKGRFDEVYFIDFPNTIEREAIIKLTIHKYGNKIQDALKKRIDPKQLAHKLGNGHERWLSGAEIKSLLDTFVKKNFKEVLTSLTNNATKDRDINIEQIAIDISLEDKAFQDIINDYNTAALATQSTKLSKNDTEYNEIKDTSQASFIDKIYRMKELYKFKDASEK